MLNARYELLLDIAATYRIQVVRAVNDKWFWWKENLPGDESTEELIGPFPSALDALEEGCKPWIETFVPWTRENVSETGETQRHNRS